MAEGIKKFGTFDLILSGALSSDGATGQVGAMVAEYLSIPHVTEIQGILSGEGIQNGVTIEAVKRYQNAKARISCKLPALMSVNFGCNEPRLPTLRSKRAAKTKPLTVYTNEELKLPADQIGFTGSPTMVVDSFAPEHKKQAQMLNGSTEEIAAQIKELIEKQKGSN